MDGGWVEYLELRGREILGVDSLSQEKVTVIHSVARWLPQTETWQYNQIKFLPPGIENHIVCKSVENLDQFCVPNIHAEPDVPRWRQFADRGLRKFQRQHYAEFLVNRAHTLDARLLHSHFGNVGWANMRAARKARLRHVISFYGLDVNMMPRQDPRWHTRYRDLFKQVERVLCEGPFMAQSVINLGCPEHKVKVHHLGVRVGEIEFKPRKYNPDRPLRVLIVAAFREKKGIPYALEVLGRLQHEIPLEITIIGDANEERRNQIEKGKILKTIEKHKLQQKTRMLGYRPCSIIFEEAYKHHIFISPSITASDGDTEGGAPVTLMEMVATGMPVISTNHCDIPEIIKHGTTGLLAEEHDVAGLVDHIRWLISHPKQWEGMLYEGRHHVEMEYDAQRQGQRLALIYNSMLA